MLEELELTDLGPIRHALLMPSEGMTAITGETGAGKSMLLSALRMICGQGTQSERVSPGATQAWAQGIFAAGDDPQIAQLVEEAGLTMEDGELFLSRTVPTKGRSRAVACGKSVPRSLLQNLSEHLIAIHGQSEQLRIAAPAKQREFLDSYAGHADLLDAYHKAWQEYRELEERLKRLTSQEDSLKIRAEYLRESILRIEKVDPQEGELDQLKQERDRIEHSAQITQGVSEALTCLDASQLDTDSDEGSAIQALEQAQRALESINLPELFAEDIQRLGEAAAEINDVVFNLTSHVNMEDNPDDLDRINERIFTLGELTKNWGPEISDVLQWLEKAKLEVEDLDASPEQLEALRKKLAKARDTAWQAAQQLSASRTRAAKELAQCVNGELANLAMRGAELNITVTARAKKTELDANGCDTVEFMFTPYPGSPQLPMGKSASGGELSRLMLALELAAAGARDMDSYADHESGMTFIFDEVDAGVGGKTAVELGKRLATLARTAQVIVVTHLPQVASWASKQFVVSKESAQGDDGMETATTVSEVTGEARVEEIARMLSGSASRTSLEHARELIQSSSLDN